MSSRVSEWESKWSLRRAKKAVRSQQMSEQCKRTSKLRSEWPSAQCVNFIRFLPNVQRGPILRTVSIASNFHLLPCTLTLAQWLANTHNMQDTSLAFVAFIVACGFAQGLLEQNHTRNFLRYFMLTLLLDFSKLFGSLFCCKFCSFSCSQRSPQFWSVTIAGLFSFGAR